MARIGGPADDYNKEAAALEAAMKARKGTAAAEVELKGALDQSSGALENAAAKTRLYRKAKQEADELAARSAKVHIADARALDVETAAVERNAKARATAAALQRGAVRGANDPLFARAYGIADPVTGVSQSQLRSQLQVGSQRAAALQAAVAGGFKPAPTETGALHGPISRRQDAELAYADAQRRAARARTDADKLTADTDKQVAQANIAAARAAEEKAAADRQVALDERARQSRLPVPRTQAVAGPDQGSLTGRFYGGAPAATTPPPQFTPRQPVREVNPGGVVGEGRSTWVSQSLTQTTSARNEALKAQANLQADIAKKQALLNDLDSTSVTRQGELAEASKRVGATYGATSQQMLRHGALSSEFIQAAVKGQASIKQIGQQALITAGKFGAWTLAATAVYGVVRAIGSVGQGAIQGQSGAHQLTRVINNVDIPRAGRQFNQLSGQFGVPIKDAADAVYRMGQVFHDQGDAAEAAKASLYSYQTGEVDVATSTKNLIAIQRGFGFSSKDLLKIYDQINQAQNTFGISIGDTEAGLAKAGGTWRNAGGDLDYLLGMFVAISKATGRSGTEIGTGIARAANQIRKPASQAILRSQGVDVDPNNLQVTMQRAIEAARKKGADYNRIAAGVFGNQYARLFAPVLRDPSGLNAALSKTGADSPGVHNSAKRELDRRKQQIDYQITQIGVNMGRIGEALGRSGALDGIGLMVKGLNAVLRLTDSLLNVFDGLPGPLKTALIVLGEMALVMKTMRRFGVSDAIGSSLGFQGSKDRQLARGVTTGLEAGQQAARDEAERLTRRSVSATAAANRAQATRNLVHEETNAALASGAIQPGTKDHQAALDARIKSDRAAAVAAQRAAEAEIASAEAMEEAAGYDRELVNVKKVQAEAGARGVVAYMEQNRATALMPNNTLIGPGNPPISEQEAARIAQEDAGKQAAAIGAATGGRELGTLEQKVAPLAAGLRTAGAAGSNVAQKVNPLGPLARGTATGLEAGARGLQGFAGGLKGVVGGIGRFAAAMGPLDYILIGFIAFTAIQAKVDEVNKALDKADTALSAPVRSKAQGVAQRHVKVPNTHNVGDLISIDAADTVQDPFAIRSLTESNYENPYAKAERLKQEKQDARDAEKRRQRLMAESRAKGPYHPVALQFEGDVTKEMSAEHQDVLNGVKSQREFKKLLAKNLIEIKTAVNSGDKGAHDRAMAEYTQLKGSIAPIHDFRTRFKGLDPKGLQSELDAAQALASSGDHEGLHLREAAYLYERIRDKIGNQHDATSLQALLKARQVFFQTIEDQYNTELQLALGDAKTESQRQAAYAKATRATSQLVAIPKGHLAHHQSLYKNEEAKLIGDQSALAGAQIADALGPDGPIPGGISAIARKAGIKRLQDRIKGDNARLADLAKRTKADEGDIKAAEQEQKKDKQALRDAGFQDRTQGRSIDLAYEQSKTTDPSKQAAEAVKSARAGVADAARTYGVGSREWRAAMTTLNQSKQQRNQTILDATDAENALMEASAALNGDSVDVAKAAERAAVNTLNAALAAGLDAKQIAKYRAAVMQAHVATRQATSQANAAAVASQGAIRSAYATADPTGVAGLKADITNANDAYNQVATDPSLHGRDRATALRNANAARIQANIALKNYYIQQAEEMRQLSFQLKASNTDDPIAKARIAYYASLDAVRSARTPQERVQAKIQAHDNLRAWKDAKIQGREDDIDFDLEMNKISRDDAITRYQALLRNSDLTKAERRDIQRKIKQLRDDSANAASGFDLDVGSIKLPTIYDVRRAIGELKPGGSKYAQGAQPVQNKIDVNVNINDQKTRVDVTTLDTATSTTVPATMQQAGLTL